MNIEEGIHLSKKERKLLKKEQGLQGQERDQKIKKVRNWIIGLLAIGLLGVGGWWVIKESSKPLPGVAVEDLGRKHIVKAEWEKYKYNSNPPTSGPHDAEWIRAGVFDTPQRDGYLIHSLEHGYIIISYNCEKIKISQGLIQKAFAHGTEEEHAREATDEAKLDDTVWESKACDDLKKQLSDFAKEQKLSKLIVMPRPELDVQIALTAWTRILKMDKIDKESMRRFIDSYRDHGPEQTTE